MPSNRAAYNRRHYEKNREKIREQKRINMQRYRAENPEIHRARSRQARIKQRQAVFEMYGHECVLCGFADKRALTLDHIKNNGAEERLELGERGVYRRAIAEFRPDEYRILCMNCQFIKRIEANRQNQHEPAVVRAAWELLSGEA